MVEYYHQWHFTLLKFFKIQFWLAHDIMPWKVGIHQSFAIFMIFVYEIFHQTLIQWPFQKPRKQLDRRTNFGDLGTVLSFNDPSVRLDMVFLCISGRWIRVRDQKNHIQLSFRSKYKKPISRGGNLSSAR